MRAGALTAGVAACLLAQAAAAPPARAGKILSVTDPRALERPVFPNAEVKIVTFELTSVGGDQRGKQQARALHRQLLARLADLAGGAVITFVTPPAGAIGNLKVDAEKVARAQKAQMVLWGRVLTDRAGKSLINARLTLVVPPRGIETSYDREIQPRAGVPPLKLSGIVRGPVGERVIELGAGGDVAPLATFLSGLARYYKADRAASAQGAIPWLKKCAAEMERYARDAPPAGNGASVADALLYAARANVRLADAEPKRAAAYLDAAWSALARAAQLDAYDPGIPTAQAIVAIRLGRALDDVRPYLARAVTLAPADSDARLNLALLDSARGKIADAVRQTENARFVSKARNGTDFAPAKPVQEQLQDYQNEIQR